MWVGMEWSGQIREPDTDDTMGMDIILNDGRTDYDIFLSDLHLYIISRLERSVLGVFPIYVIVI
jgi:hypothetical protein